MKHIKSLAVAAIMFSTGVNANNIPESPSIDSFDTVVPSFVQEKKDFNF